MPVEYDDEAIPGVAGIDYPAYSTIPDTKFVCDSQEHPGLYADTDAQCQVSDEEALFGLYINSGYIL